jgi:hypothetical protein
MGIQEVSLVSSFEVRINPSSNGECDGACGESTTAHLTPCCDCDGSGQDGAFKNTVGHNGERTAHCPQDVLRIWSVHQFDNGARSGREGDSLEEKHGRS